MTPRSAVQSKEPVSATPGERVGSRALLPHLALYGATRSGAGVLRLCTTFLLTRLLAPRDYGVYAVALTAVGFSYAFGFGWMRSAITRFLPSTRWNTPAALGTIKRLFLGVATTGSIATVLWVNLVWPKSSVAAVVLSVTLLWSHAWFELEREIARSSVRALLYARLSLSRAALFTTMAVTTAAIGLGAKGVLWSWAASAVIAIIVFNRTNLLTLKAPASTAVMREYLSYGAPMAASLGLWFVIASSDRVLLAWLVGPEATGVYSATYDVAEQTIGVLVIIINLACVPIITRAWEDQGIAAARVHLERQAVVLMSIVPAAVIGVCMTAHEIAFTLLGHTFSAGAAGILALVAIATGLGATKLFYVDTILQLAHRRRAILLIAFLGAALNVVLNLWLIPKLGTLGSAQATLVTYAVVLMLAAVYATSITQIRIKWSDGLIVAAALAAMVGVLRMLPLTTTFIGYFAKTGLAATVYGGVMLLRYTFKARGDGPQPGPPNA